MWLCIGEDNRRETLAASLIAKNKCTLVEKEQALLYLVSMIWDSGTSFEKDRQRRCMLGRADIQKPGK
jgi:hypothetical protein